MKSGNTDRCEESVEINTVQNLNDLTVIDETKYVKLIADVDELKWFFDNVLPSLKSTETYFLSLSGRNKYLTDEEKQYYQLGRNEMFAKSIVRERDWNRFLRTIRKLECNEEGYTTKNNLPIPSKCIVCYININPSNTLKALSEFNKIINEYMFELSNVAVKKLDSENIMNRINKIDNNLMTCYQQATGIKYWVDFDLDVDKNWKVYGEIVLKEWLKNKKVSTYYWIDTKSGYHLLVYKEDLNFNPSELVDYIKQGYGNWLFYEYDCEIAKEKLANCEIMYNTNSMIPLPGCYQANHIVRIINK